MPLSLYPTSPAKEFTVTDWDKLGTFVPAPHFSPEKKDGIVIGAEKKGKNVV